MKISRGDMRALLSVCAILVGLLGCEYQGPEAIWDPNQPLGEAPVIEQVVPPSRAAAGVNEIKLIGNNFSPDPAGNKVYIGGVEIPIKSASKSEIRVYRPTVVGDLLWIRVVVQGAAIMASHHPYRIDEVKFLVDALEGGLSVAALAVDKDENLYALNAQRNVRMVTPNGDISTYAAIPTRIIPRNVTEMRMGPNGYMYLASNAANLDRIVPGGGTVERFGSIPQSVQYFDFDENGNIFAGGPRGLFVVNSTGAATAVGQYEGFEIKAVRVFAPYVYVAARNTGTNTVGIWKSRIESASGNLGDKQLFFDWAQAGDFAKVAISAMTIAEDGNVYVGTNDRTVTNPILMISSDGSQSEALYSGILDPGAERMVWGTGNSLYVSRGFSGITTRRVLRIDMGKKGAPDYGRK
ncbi:MAG: IPT/TIG domain-containing protein [candidate division KSB1 bacterium]|nr:IPT/TIG domain-containing protein [candidate division KSB1 bacterium]